METITIIIFGIIFIYVAVLAGMALTKSKIPQIAITIGKYALILLISGITLYYIFKLWI